MTEMTTSSSTTSRSSLSDQLEIIEVKPGLRFSKAMLKELLPDVETVLFFGKVYDLDYRQLSTVLYTVVRTPLSEALSSGDHSTELQQYLIGYEDEFGFWHEGVIPPMERGDINFSPDVPHGEILPELWSSMEIEVASSIKKVAEKLESVVNHMPGKQGAMVFQSMRVMNAKRPIIGDYKAKIHHAPQKENLVILDVSGSVTEHTIRTIVDDVIAMSYMANAHLAIVSNTCTYWPAGAYGSDDVLAAAEFGGTHYETLEDLFDRDWGVVVTVADYDSSLDSKRVIARCTGRIDEVLDISLVNRPTFLAEVVGQLADSVRPLLVASTSRVLNS